MFRNYHKIRALLNLFSKRRKTNKCKDFQRYYFSTVFTYLPKIMPTSITPIDIYPTQS
jgi:hypothetical protein